MTYLVTGASKGIGLELARQLKARGESVIATCRTRSPALDALDVEVIDAIDVSDPASIDVLVRKLGERTLDVLINNAGILAHDSLADLDLGRIRRQFEVNALGPLVVTHALLPRLAHPSKVVLVTSRMGSIGDNGSGGMYGYRMSKAALNMAGASLARDLRSRGVTVLVVHPGMVATEMTGQHGIPVADSARNLIARIDEATLERSGSFVHASGEPLPW